MYRWRTNLDKQDIKKPGSAIVRRDRTEKTGSDEEKLMILLGRKKKSYVWMNIEIYGKIQLKLKTSMHIGMPRQLFCVVLQKGHVAGLQIIESGMVRAKNAKHLLVLRSRPPDCTVFFCELSARNFPEFCRNWEFGVWRVNHIGVWVCGKPQTESIYGSRSLIRTPTGRETPAIGVSTSGFKAFTS